MNNTTCMSTSNLRFQVIYEVNIQVIVLTVLAFSQRILKLGLKMRSFSKSAFPGLLKNVLTFNPRWLEERVPVAQTSELSRTRTPENPKTIIFKPISLKFSLNRLIFTKVF